MTGRNFSEVTKKTTVEDAKTSSLNNLGNHREAGQLVTSSESSNQILDHTSGNTWDPKAFHGQGESQYPQCLTHPSLKKVPARK